MRPVNLIPAEDRHDGHGPMRTGPVPYLLVGALVAALLGVTALVLTSNQIADSRAEVVQLKREDGQTMAEYGLLIAFIAIVALVGVTLLGTSLSSFFSDLAGKV